jgi:uncharacterized iron-regulated protein
MCNFFLRATLVLSLASLGSLGACAPGAATTGPRSPSAATDGDDDPHGMHGHAHGHAHGEGAGPIDIRRAALPFRVLRGHGGTEVAEADFFADLAAADAICLGEAHPNPHHHWMQLMVLEHLAQAAEGKRQLGVGLEMFATPFQGVLDDFAAGKIDEAALLARTGWEERWGYDFGFYRPMIALAVAGKHALLALNAPRELAHQVNEVGLDKLSPTDKKALPELDLKDEAHRAWFEKATGGHTEGGGKSFDDFYAAQVVWDETMADTATRWLKGGAKGEPPRQIAILAGVGHCLDAAVPKRMRRRGVGRTVSVQAVLDEGGAEVSDLLAAPENDYVIVLDASGATGPATPATK